MKRWPYQRRKCAAAATDLYAEAIQLASRARAYNWQIPSPRPLRTAARNSTAALVWYSAHSDSSASGLSCTSPSRSRKITRAFALVSGLLSNPAATCWRYCFAALGRIEMIFAPVGKDQVRTRARRTSTIPTAGTSTSLDFNFLDGSLRSSAPTHRASISTSRRSVGTRTRRALAPSTWFDTAGEHCRCQTLRHQRTPPRHPICRPRHDDDNFALGLQWT